MESAENAPHICGTFSDQDFAQHAAGRNGGVSFLQVGSDSSQHVRFGPIERIFVLFRKSLHSFSEWLQHRGNPDIAAAAHSRALQNGFFGSEAEPRFALLPLCKEAL